MSKHALYATCKNPTTAQSVTFRVGQPTDWGTAIDRHTKATNRLIRSPYIRNLRRKYPVSFYEVRAVDEHGRGLGQERHALAIPVHGQKQHRIKPAGK